MRLSVLVLLFFPLLGFGQSASFPDIGFTWTEAHYGMMGMESSTPGVHEVVDTMTIGEHLYHKVGLAYFRAENQKWYTKESVEAEEVLYMDYSLEAGDTLYYSNPYIPQEQQVPYFNVTLTDTVEMLNGEFVKRLHLSYGSDSMQAFDIWYENMGPEYGLFRHGFAPPWKLDYGWVETVCMVNEIGELLYENPVPDITYAIGWPSEIVYENCYWYVGLEEYEQNLITIYPNPASHELLLSHSSPEMVIRMFDASGRELQVTRQASKVIVSELESGYYVLHLDYLGSTSVHRFYKE